jgi:YD repeat-containing protein
MRRSIGLLLALCAVDAASAETQTYQYDARGRLIVVDTTGSSVSRVATYGNDRADNRTAVTSTDRTGGLVPIYRFYNGKHFYTPIFSEGINASFTSEGLAFKTYSSSASGMHALYRCYAGSGDHFVSTASNCEGQTVISSLGYVFDSAGTGRTALYRFYGSIGEHLITTNYAEGVAGGYTYEFVLGYVPQ